MRVNPGVVPGFFTMANMFCGFLSTLQAAKGEYMQAAWLIVAAAILDTLDGKLARLTESSSDFGVQYDSMADVVSFGLAPSALAYFVFLNQWGPTGVFLSFMPLVFGSVRLARFNVRDGGQDKSFFQGIPIPAAAMAIATFVIFNYNFWDHIRWSKLFLFIILFVSIMMITTVRYEKMPHFSLRTNRANRMKVIFVLASSLVLFFFPHEVFFPLTMGYVFSGLVRLFYRILNTTEEDKPLNNEDSET